NLGVKAQEHMQMVIHDREAADRYREDFRKFLQAPIDPFLAVEFALREQEGAADAARNAVIPTSQRDIDKVSAGDRHSAVSWCDRPMVSNRTRRCQYAVPVLFCFSQYTAWHTSLPAQSGRKSGSIIPERANSWSWRRMTRGLPTHTGSTIAKRLISPGRSIST